MKSGKNCEGYPDPTASIAIGRVAKEERAETHACDLISRQSAIDATWFEPSYTDPLNVLTEVRDRLKALPPAQPEKRTEERVADPDRDAEYRIKIMTKALKAMARGFGFEITNRVEFKDKTTGKEYK